MNIALFGGTFDPPHLGHLAAAQAAQTAFQLDEVLFIPARVPPHKRGRRITEFAHRFAMVALACSGNSAFVPSLLEWDESGIPAPNYSIDTVRKVAARLGSADRLFFVVGVDSFLGIGTWKQPVDLLDACDFIIVSRPGFPIEEITSVIPAAVRSSEGAPMTHGNRIPLRRTCLHLLTTVRSDVSASEIRRRAARRESLCGLVTEAVGEYIRKTQLYVDAEQIG